MNRRIACLLVLTLAGLAGVARASPYEIGWAGATRDYGRSLDVGDPVSAATGAHHFRLPLLNLGGPLDLRFDLFYRSDLERWGQELPYKFWWGPVAAIGFDTISNVPYARAYLPDSRQIAFVQNTNDGTWSLTGPAVQFPGFIYTDNVPRVKYRLQATETRRYVADPESGRLYVFEAYDAGAGITNARIRRIVDRNTNALVFSFDATGNLVTNVSDGLGRALDLAYTNMSQTGIRTATDQAGRRVTFAYENKAGDNTVIWTLRAVTNAGGGGFRFGYGDGSSTEAHFITNTVRPRGNSPYSRSYNYRDMYSNSTMNRVSWEMDAYSNETSFSYALYTNPLTITFTTGAGRATNRIRHSSSHGFPVYLTDAHGATIHFTQDTNGHLRSVTDRRGGTTAFDYEPASGLLAGITNAAGHALRFTYAPRAQVYVDPDDGDTVTNTFFDLAQIDYPDGSGERYACDGSGNTTQFTDRAGAAWRAAYNAHGQVTTLADPAGGSAAFVYNPDATLHFAVDADGVGATNGYDAAKRRTSIMRGDGARAGWGFDELDRLTAYTNELGGVTTYTYDANGNVLAVTDPLGQAKGFEYDLLDRLVAATNRSGGVTTYTYDPRGKVAAVTNPAGVGIQYGYDANGRLTEIRVGTSIWTIGRDAEGLPVSVTDPLGNTAGMVRDVLGNVMRITNAAGHEITLTRDVMQQITSCTDLLGRTWNYGYDLAGRLETVTVPAAPLPHATSNRYDAAGRLAAVTDLNTQEWNFTYTAAGRLQAVTDPLSNTWQTVHDENGRPAGGTLPDGTAWTNQYDAAGRATNRSWSGGPSLAYGYDANGRLVAADQVTLAYNPDGLVTGSVQAGEACAYSYDPAGRLTGITYPGGLLSVAYTYDPTNGLPATAGDTLTGTSIGYECDAALRPIRIARPNGVDTEYTWDAASQLTRIQDGTNLDLLYSYDSAGQVTQVVANTPLAAMPGLASAVATQAVDAASQLAAAPYAYDACGRLTNLPGMALAWDHAGRLVHIGAATLEFDGFGRPLRRSEAGQTNGLYYSFANGLDGLLAERDENTGQWRRFYVWSPGGNLLYLVDVAAGNQVRYFHFDRGGNTRALTDAAGNVTDAYAYSPFGRLLARTGTSDQPFLFMGQYGVRREGATGLHHARARFYDADTGRFLTREPVWPQIARPETLNPYVYAKNNPVDFTDPSGLIAIADPEIFAETFSEVLGDTVADAYAVLGPPGVVLALRSLGFSDSLETTAQSFDLGVLDWAEMAGRAARQRRPPPLPTAWLMLPQVQSIGTETFFVDLSATPLVPADWMEPVAIRDHVGMAEAFQKAMDLLSPESLSAGDLPLEVSSVQFDPGGPPARLADVFSSPGSLDVEAGLNAFDDLEF